MSEIIERGDVENFSKWIIQMVNNMNEFNFALCSGYNDYTYINEVMVSILKGTGDYYDALTTAITIDTVSTSTEGDYIKTGCSFLILNKIKEAFGREGSLLFVQYEKKEAFWHNYVLLFEDESQAKERREFLIKVEMAGIDNIIEELTQIKNQIGIENNF
ncbi:hypothetical protein [Heliophilum fasciatum]|uniref:Uncharacterized protein n=1 Tax=Heliophilum fasciatum TaxID=35700 RepID=A0A4R2RFW6_9FIRM|nr:hypothetical protein [Heliophilum fasciatum]MCW2278719.1 hypothetical protein [Heliophilum fasciatum]TCP62542.1 hypothetical protein EDD73_12140 [Heliophilum fasciatum]